MPILKYRLKHIVEYAFLRGYGFLIRILPYRMALLFGWVLAMFAFYVVRWRRGEAEKRIRTILGPDISSKRVRWIARHSLKNLVFNVIDSIRLPDLTPRWVEKHNRGTSPAEIMQKMNGKGGILTLLHMGSWDLAGATCAVMGMPIFFIVGVQKNPLVDDYINRMRISTGAGKVPRNSRVLRGVARKLEEGKVLAIMSDLRSKTPGVVVQFLGHEANLAIGMGMFARMAKVPIFPVVLTRRNWTLHHWELYPPVKPDLQKDRDEDVQQMTQTVMDVLGESVRKYPEQFFWYNKRWILDPLQPKDNAPSPDDPQD